MNRKLLSLAAVLLCGLTVPAGAEILGQARLEIDDFGGHPISSVPVGGDFLLKGFVQDLHVPPPNFGGVFGAVFDIPYNAGLGTASGPITFGSFFTILHSGSILPGKVHDVGAYSSSFAAPGQAEQFLFSLQLHAEHAGQMVLNPALSTTPGDDFLIYGFNNAIPAEQINFMPASVTIVPEPSTWALLASGLFLLAVSKWRLGRV